MGTNLKTQPYMQILNSQKQTSQTEFLQMDAGYVQDAPKINISLA